MENKKSKTIGIILVAIFGGFGWIYTYKKDSWKFWLYIISFISSIILFLMLSFIFNLNGLSNLNGGLYIIFMLINLILYLWAIIDYSIKPEKYFKNFK